MNKPSFYLIAFMLVCAMVPALQSCLSDNDPYPSTYFTIGTLNIIEDREYDFILDDGDKMYPGDTSDIKNYTLEDQQRVFIHFLPLEEDMPGYEYNVRLLQLQNILTKDIITLTDDNAAEVGNDRINATKLWISGDYLNIEYQFFHSDNEEKKHLLNLVINETSEASANEEEEEYIKLEFRHNAHNDEQRKTGWGIVSFRLDKIAGEMEGKKGLKIYVNSIYDGKREYIVEPEEKK